MPRLTACLWFDDQAEAAAELYCSVFPNSRITGTTGRIEGGAEGPGAVLALDLGLDGRPFMALTVEFTVLGIPCLGLNGGPMFHFTEAVSFQIDCADQADVDYYWDRLTADGGEESMCGWLKDRFGVSWQVVPRVLPQLLGGPDKAGSARAMQVMLTMRKLDIAALQAAYDG